MLLLFGRPPTIASFKQSLLFLQHLLELLITETIEFLERLAFRVKTFQRKIFLVHYLLDGIDPVFRQFELEYLLTNYQSTF